MPILTVEIIGPVARDARPHLAQRLADAAGTALDSPSRSTWVKLRFLDTDAYSENGGAPDDVRPVHVSVLLAELPDEDGLAARARRLTAAIAEVCDRPSENVHIVFEPPAAGRIAFGGTLRRRAGPSS